MLPRLFDLQDIIADSQNNLSNCQNRLGKGYFTKIKSNEIKEVLNGEYTLKMTIKTADPLAKTVQPNMCILAKPNYSDEPQAFVITAISYKDDGTIDINGEHIKGMFFNNVVLGNATQEETTLTGTPSQIVSGLLSEVLATNYFAFTSDISTSKSVKRSGTTLTLGEIFNDDRQGLIRKFNADLKFNNFVISFLAHRGKTTTSGHMAENIVRYGEKISSFNQDMSNEGEYTHILAFAEVPTRDNTSSTPIGYETVPAYNGPVRSVVLYGREGTTSNYLVPTGSQSGFKKILPVDFSKKFKNKHGYVNPSPGTGGVTGFAETENLLFEYGEEYARNHSSITAPSVSINVNYGTALDELNKVDLGDVVTVIYDPTGYVKNHRVTETVYDFVNEKYKSVTIGYRKFTLYDYLTKRIAGR